MTETPSNPQADPRRAVPDQGSVPLGDGAKAAPDADDKPVFGPRLPAYVRHG